MGVDVIDWFDIHYPEILCLCLYLRLIFTPYYMHPILIPFYLTTSITAANVPVPLLINVPKALNRLSVT
jgi:hypothetical protein